MFYENYLYKLKENLVRYSIIKQWVQMKNSEDAWNKASSKEQMLETSWYVTKQLYQV